MAWWILAAGGAVLAVVDAQTHLLPARFTYPLAAAVGIALVIGSMTGGDPAALLRAAAAAATIFAITMAIRFLSPPAMGLGDVRAATLTAGMLGWTGWITLWQGQLLIAFVGRPHRDLPADHHPHRLGPAVCSSDGTGDPHRFTTGPVALKMTSPPDRRRHLSFPVSTPRSRTTPSQ